MTVQTNFNVTLSTIQNSLFLNAPPNPLKGAKYEQMFVFKVSFNGFRGAVKITPTYSKNESLTAYPT
jgi:hypothetical protein